MQISNIRLGFATNSSSLHSVMFIKGKYRRQVMGELSDNLPIPFFAYPKDPDCTEDYQEDEDDYKLPTPGMFEFGWNFFKLTKAADKLAYLAIIVQNSMHEAGLTSYQTKAVLQQLFADTPIQQKMQERNYCYIDHQSQVELAAVNTEVFPLILQEITEFFLDERISVWGGNDNSDREMPGDFRLPCDGAGSIRIRRDGDHYVIFNWSTGAKIRISPPDTPFLKASKPELVDLKITDHCTSNCSFCYQNSTKEGKDAEHWRDIIEALGMKGLGVFEVALGGGEPTECKDFSWIINSCIENGIKPNFTTNSINWLFDDSKVAAANKCGGIGISIHSVQDLLKIKAIKSKCNVRVIGQLVFGLYSGAKTKDIISRAHYDGYELLLLGYKQVGRAVEEPLKYSTREMNDIKLHMSWLANKNHLSVDTTFVNQYSELLQELEVNERSISCTEGAFSCFLNCINNTFGPSSYCSPNEMKSLTKRPNGCGYSVETLVQEIGTQFLEFPGEPNPGIIAYVKYD